jgi:hypothetical protein
MTSKRTIHARLHKAGLTPVKDTWLTPKQAATVQKWDTENRAKALGEERKDDRPQPAKLAPGAEGAA